MAEKYDVFISFKNTDPKGGLTLDRTIAQRLHDKLIDEGLNVFFSEKDLSDTEFMNQIYSALDEANLLIVVSTSPEYVRSKWVKSEWTNFLGAINSGRKPNGKIMTVLTHMTTHNLPLELSNFQSFNAANLDEAIAYAFRTLGKISNTQARQWEKAENERKLREAEAERLKAVKAQMEAERRERAEKEKLDQANRKAADAAKKAADEEKKRLAAEEKMKRQFATKNTKIKKLSVPMIALLCVLIGGLLIGFVVMKTLSAGKVDTVDSVDETVSSSVESYEVITQKSVDSTIKNLDNNYIISDDNKIGNGLPSVYLYQYKDYFYYSYRGGALKALSLNGSKLEEMNNITGCSSITFSDDEIIYVTGNNTINIYNITSKTIKEMTLTDVNELFIEGYYNGKIFYEVELHDEYIKSGGLYCIDVSTGKSQFLYRADADTNYIEDLHIYNSELYINVLNGGIIIMSLNGSNIRELISTSCDYMIIYDEKIYTIESEGIARYDITGKNREVLINDSCARMTIYDGKIFYNPKKLKPNSIGSQYVVGDGIKCFDLNSRKTSMLFENECFLTDCSGNWVYFEDWSTNQQLCRIRLDGTGYMEMP